MKEDDGEKPIQIKTNEREVQLKAIYDPGSDNWPKLNMKMD